MEILQQIFEMCIIPLLEITAVYLIRLLDSKKKEASTKIDNEMASKYTQTLLDTISTCVKATNQTYVDSLKKSGSFDILAQKEAFAKCKEAVLSILADDAKEYLSTAYGDLDKLIENLIEAQIETNK